MIVMQASMQAHRLRQAVGELEDLICRRYPEAIFTLTASPDESQVWHLLTEVDLEDPDEILDVVLDRVLELQINDQIPIHVIPMRSTGASSRLREHVT